MAGDFRDPMVGRDILVGGLLGLCHTLAIYLTFLLPHSLGIVVPPVEGINLESLLGMRGMVVLLLFALAVPIFHAVATPFLLLLFHAVLRRNG